MALLSIEFDHGPPCVLRVGGEVDVAAAGEFRAALGKALAEDPSVVVDLAGVSFIDAAGLRVILQAAASLDGAAPLVLENSSCVEWLLALVGLDDDPSIRIRHEVRERGR